MDKIVCLVGESGSGKTTIAELLEKEGLNYIQSYTTRKPRYEGEKGHIFIDRFEARELLYSNKEEDIIAYTFFNEEYYFATKEQYQGKGTSIYIIDVAGIKELKQRVKGTEIIIIYLKTDEITRKQRMIKRYQEYCNSLEQDCIEFSNVLDRLKHDREAFKIVNCDYAIDSNRGIEEILKDVKSIIALNEQ